MMVRTALVVSLLTTLFPLISHAEELSASQRQASPQEAALVSSSSVPSASSTPSARSESSAPSAAPAKPVAPRTLLGPAPPYVPRNTDYSVELGVIGTRDEELFWVGGNIGKHLGRCVFTESQTCQQYLDVIAGAGVREAESHGMFLLSPRWQYVNLPDRYSSFWRLFAGPSLTARGSDRGWRGAFGAGIGVTNYLHQNVDLRLELRGGAEDARSFAQVVVGAQIKVDRLLEYFAVKLKDFGVGAVGTIIDATGTAVEATGEGLGGIVEGVSSPFKKGEREGGGKGPKEEGAASRKAPLPQSSPQSTPKP